MKRFLSLSLVTLLCLSLLPVSVAAQNTTTFGLAPLAERQTVSVGFFSGSAHSIPFYIAEQEGFFDELNIDIEYQSFINGPAMMEANASWDIADVGGPGVLVGQLGYDVRMVGVCDYEENLGLFVRADSPIALAGKGGLVDHPEVFGNADVWKNTKWLYPVGTNLHMTLAAAINSFGLTMDDIESVNMDVSSAFTAFRGGEWEGVKVDSVDLGYTRYSRVNSTDQWRTYLWMKKERECSIQEPKKV